MHFSGSSRSDCLALVEAFRVSVCLPSRGSVFSHLGYEFLLMVLVRASVALIRVTTPRGSSGEMSKAVSRG